MTNFDNDEREESRESIVFDSHKDRLNYLYSIGCLGLVRI